jgi:hypothetical protein
MVGEAAVYPVAGIRCGAVEAPAELRAAAHNSSVVNVRGMPWGVGLFLAYAFLVLAAGGLALGPVVERAVLIPITFEGVVLMALLAYSIFTITLVLQRKAAARGLSLGLVSLVLPAIPLLLLWGQVILAVVVAVLGLLLYRGLRAPRSLAWLDQE